MPILGYGDRLLSSGAWTAVVQGVTSPVGVLTPEFIGQRFINIEAQTVYEAVGLTSSDWSDLSSGGGGSGTNDHTQLINIGTNTHAQIDTALSRLENTSGTNTGDVAFGTTAGTACQGNDSRLSDARTPTTHGSDKHSVTYLVAGDAVVPNTAITGATKTKITYDSKGLVTAGADATASDVGAVATTDIQGDYAAPVYVSSTTDATSAIIAAIATGKTVDLGGAGKNWKVTGTLGALNTGQGIISHGAIITYSANALLLKMVDNTFCDIIVYGSGKASGSTSQHAIYVDPANATQSCQIKLRAYDMGGAAFYITRNASASLRPTRFDVYADNCNYGLFADTSGEYVVGVLNAYQCVYGAYLKAGNAKIIGGSMTQCQYGVMLVSGTNDAHGGVHNCSINHTTSAAIYAYGTTNKEFVFSNCHIYAGSITFNAAVGVILRDCGMGVVTFNEFGGDQISVANCVFSSAPTINSNSGGTPSCVHYYNNEFTGTVLATDSDLRVPTAQSKMSLSANQTIATTVAAAVQFNNVIKKALQTNTNFTKYELFNAAGYSWRPKTFSSPASDNLMTYDLRVSVGALTAFTHTLCDVYLSLQGSTGTETDRIYLCPSNEFTSGSYYYRIYTLEGRVRKYDRMQVIVNNRTAGDVVVLADSAATPTLGYVTGW